MAAHHRKVCDVYAVAFHPQSVYTSDYGHRIHCHDGANDAGVDDAGRDCGPSSHWMDRAFGAHVDAVDEWPDNLRIEVADVARAGAEGQRKSFPKSAP